MTKTRTANDEDAWLRGAERIAGDPQHVRLECLHATKPLLRKAGFLNPVPFRRYIVPVVMVGGKFQIPKSKFQGR